MVCDSLLRSIDYRFSDSKLLSQALTHRSYGQPNNERLEFLGDSVVNHVVALSLFERFPGLNEGELSRLRAHLVCQGALYELAQEVGLGEHLLLGEGERKSGGHRRPSILSDAFEALIAAIFLDGGYAAAKTFVNQMFATRLDRLDPEQSLKDPKTRLQEWLQARKRPLPKYEMVDVQGEAHAQAFHVDCIINSNLKTRGSGTSRRNAEQASAAAALDILESGPSK